MIEPTSAAMESAPDTERDTLYTRNMDGARFLRRATGARQGSASHPTLLVALTSAFGLIAWITLTLLTGGKLTPPGAPLISDLFTQWRVAQIPGVSASHPYGFTASAATRASLPLSCNSSGASSLGYDLVVPQSEVICGDVLVVGANAITRGDVRGSIQVIGGNATISGNVTGDVTVIGGDVNVQSGGHVYGVAHALGGAVHITPGAIVRSAGDDIHMPQDLARPPGLNFSIDIGSFWLSLLFWMSAALGLTAIAPETIGRVRYMISRHMALSAVVGVILTLSGGLISLALVFTCLGIPLALAIAVAGWLAWVVGTVSVGAWLGSAIFGGPYRSRPPSLLASAVLGVLILSILKALPVIGPVIGLLVGAVALGAAALTLLSARRSSYARLR